MNEPQDADRAGHLIEAVAAVNARSQKLLAEYLSHGGTDDAYSVLDPAVIARTFQDMGAQLMMRPDLILREQTAFWLDYVQLCQRTMSRVMFNKPVEPMVAPAANDKRFKDSDWADHYVFDFFKQCYLLVGRRVEAAVLFAWYGSKMVPIVGVGSRFVWESERRSSGAVIATALCTPHDPGYPQPDDDFGRSTRVFTSLLGTRS